MEHEKVVSRSTFKEVERAQKADLTINARIVEEARSRKEGIRSFPEKISHDETPTNHRKTQGRKRRAHERKLH